MKRDGVEPPEIRSVGGPRRRTRRASPRGPGSRTPRDRSGSCPRGSGPGSSEIPASSRARAAARAPPPSATAPAAVVCPVRWRPTSISTSRFAFTPRRTSAAESPSAGASESTATLSSTSHDERPRGVPTSPAPKRRVVDEDPRRARLGKTCASPVFATVRPPAPSSSWLRPISGDLCVLVCGQSAMPCSSAYDCRLGRGSPRAGRGRRRRRASRSRRGASRPAGPGACPLRTRPHRARSIVTSLPERSQRGPCLGSLPALDRDRDPHSRARPATRARSARGASASRRAPGRRSSPSRTTGLPATTVCRALTGPQRSHASTGSRPRARERGRPRAATRRRRRTRPARGSRCGSRGRGSAPSRASPSRARRARSSTSARSRSRPSSSAVCASSHIEACSEPAPSTARPTLTPARAHRRRPAATPSAIRQHVVGQCATPVPHAREPGDLVVVDEDAVRDPRARARPADALEPVDRLHAELLERPRLLAGILREVRRHPHVVLLGQLRGGLHQARASRRRRRTGPHDDPHHRAGRAVVVGRDQPLGVGQDRVGVLHELGAGRSRPRSRPSATAPRHGSKRKPTSRAAAICASISFGRGCA